MCLKSDKPIVETERFHCVSVTVLDVFKANFNDAYYWDTFYIRLSDLNREQLTWFDPFGGRSFRNEISVAIAYCSDEKLVILEKKNGKIEKIERSTDTDCIVCEDKNDSVILAAHMRLEQKP